MVLFIDISQYGTACDKYGVMEATSHLQVIIGAYFACKTTITPNQSPHDDINLQIHNMP